MKHNPAPSVADILFLVVAPLTAITRTVKLTHSDGDLAAHIRMGQVILETRSIPRQSIASVTAAGEPFVVQAWLSEVIFAWLFSAGGLAAISVAAGIVVATTHAGIAYFLTRRGVDPRWALASALLSLAISSTHWLARPHMFSILGVALTVSLLESRGRWRLVAFGVTYCIWANLHAGWLYGLMLIATYALGHLLEARFRGGDKQEEIRQLKVTLAAFAIASLSTIVNPFGLELHKTVVSGATSSVLARQMAEFAPPDFQSLAALPFLAGLLITIGLLALAPGRMRIPHLLVVLIATLLALRSFRNMALFGVSAWPLVALHVSRSWPASWRTFPAFRQIALLDRTATVGRYAAAVSLALIVIGLNSGMLGGTRIIRDRFSNDKFPVAAVDQARTLSLPGPVFTSWGWAGYSMFAWPGAAQLVDPLKFNTATTTAYAAIESARPGWSEKIEKWKIRTVIIPPDTRLARALEQDGRWELQYRDSTAAVYSHAAEPARTPR